MTKKRKPTKKCKPKRLSDIYHDLDRKDHISRMAKDLQETNRRLAAIMEDNERKRKKLLTQLR